MKLQAIALLVMCGGVFAIEQCCEPNEIIRQGGYCGISTERIYLNCPLGHMLLKDVIVKGTMVTTKDLPHYIFVEDPKQFCVGEMLKNASDVALGTIPVAVTCYQEANDKDFEISGVLTLISVFFLIITIGVYMFLPDLRDLQGQCYMCMCVSMAIGFLSLGILQLNPGFIGEICTLTGFLIYFWMMATFFWMNVISINMYRTVIDASYLKKTERKQYLIYSCYAWGCTILFLIVALITNFSEGDHLKPDIGVSNCWIKGRTETWLFFYGPVAILIVSNVVLFVMSSTTLWKHNRKYEISKLNNLKHRFLLSLKLFLVMGISWVFEIASFAHGESHVIWKIMDTFNCLQGLVIFLLLVVLRKRAMRGLSKEGCCLFLTSPMAEKLSPHDDSCDQNILTDDHTEVRLN